MLDIKMRTGVHASHVNIALLVDSGASYNLFHGSWANLLGVTLTSTNTLTFSGIAPNATVTGYLGTVQLGFDEKFYDTPVYFSFDLPPTCDSMLGKHGFFDRFIVEIDDGQKSLTIREADVLTPRKYECCPHCQSNAENTSNYCYVCGASLFASATQHGFLTFPGLSTYRSI